MESTRPSPDDPPASAAIPAARAPRLGPWRLVRRLGKGGMGAVYEGLDESSGRRRAIKTLLAVPGAQFFEEDMRRFRREASLVTRLSHPHVVRVEAAHLEHAPPYLVMELLTGGTLKDRLRRGPLPVQEALGIGRKLCAALGHAHQLGALHRDLKPANVLFDAKGEPKLADFGLGRDTGVSVERLTQTGEVLGTPAYMAPEQTVDAKRVDARSDVHGLGALLYAMLSGHSPFKGETLGEVLRAVRHSLPSPLRDDRPELPLAVEAICQRAMAKDPDDRYPSATAMGDAIALATDRGETPSPEPRGRRAPIWLVPLGLVTVLGASVGAGALLSTRSAPTPNPDPGTAPTAPTTPEARPLPSASPSPLGQARTRWGLRPDQDLTYELTVSPSSPGDLELERASLSLLLSLSVTSVESSQARIQATILRVRAWADPRQGLPTHYDTATQRGMPGPTEELLAQAHQRELTFSLDTRTGEVSQVTGISLSTADLLNEPAAWPARELASLLSAGGFEACWDALARLKPSSTGPELGEVTSLRERPRAALLLDPTGLVWRLAQVKIRVLARGEPLVGWLTGIRNDENDHNALRRVASVWLTNGILDPDRVAEGWPLVEPPGQQEFPEPLELLGVTAHTGALRATPWGPLVHDLKNGQRLGGSARVEAGFRLVCLQGGLAWCREEDLDRAHGRWVVVTDRLNQAYAYRTRERVGGDALGVARQGTAYPLLDRQPGPDGEVILIPFLGTGGWILAKDADVRVR